MKIILEGMNLETVSEKLRSEEITPEILNFLSGKGLEKLWLNSQQQMAIKIKCSK